MSDPKQKTIKPTDPDDLIRYVVSPRTDLDPTSPPPGGSGVPVPPKQPKQDQDDDK